MKKIQQILIIRFRRVGDAVISTVLCSSLKKTFPEATIDYVLNEGIAPLFENHPDINNIITFNNDDMVGFSAYTKKIRRIMQSGKYDLIIDCRSTIKTLWFSIFSLTTPYRIGRKKSYNMLIHNFRVDNRGDIDEVDKTLMLLQPLEKYTPICYDRNFRVYVTPEEKEQFDGYMEQKGIDFSKPIIVCAVTARLVHKIWDKERMKKILQQVIDRYDVQLIFNYGGKEEQEFALQLHEEMSNHPRIFTNIEAQNLRELAAMLTSSAFFFGNEGGPRHISQALNIPSLAIYPPQTSKKEWLPNACERFQGIEPADISERATSPDLSYKEKFDIITESEVWKRLEPMLEQYIIQ